MAIAIGGVSHFEGGVPGDPLDVFASGLTSDGTPEAAASKFAPVEIAIWGRLAAGSERPPLETR